MRPRAGPRHRQGRQSPQGDGSSLNPCRGELLSCAVFFGEGFRRRVSCVVVESSCVGCFGRVVCLLLVVVVVWFSTRRWLRVFSMVLGVFVVGGVALLVGFV